MSYRNEKKQVSYLIFRYQHELFRVKFVNGEVAAFCKKEALMRSWRQVPPDVYIHWIEETTVEERQDRERFAEGET